MSVNIICGSQKCLNIATYQRHDFVICDMVRFGTRFSSFRKTLVFLFMVLLFYPEDGSEQVLSYIWYSYQTTRRHIPVDRNLENEEFNETSAISQLIRKPCMESVG